MVCEISLTRGMVAVIDDVDGDLSAMRWHAAKSGTTGRTFYAVHSVDPKTKLMLHRAVADR